MRSLVVGLALAVVPPTPAPPIDDYLATALDSTGLPGVSVVVTHGNRVVRATGAGHDSTGSPMTADTPMRVASVSKSFTAAAVLTLGVDLDAPVTDWLPSFARGVTVRQLLNQTSGLRDSSVDIGRLTSARTLAEYVSMLPPVTLTAPPGTSWAYSNVNYDVAARLVEVVSGQPFDVYMRENVFGPLGMRDSSVGGSAPDGYNSLFGLWFSRPELSDGPTVNGSGAVVTTAQDMGRWLMAQTGNGPFSASMLKTMHDPSTVDEYGMGWSPGDDGLLVHSGNLWTYNAIQAIDPKTGYGYVVMTNGAGLADDTGDILAGLVALTRGEKPEVPGGSRQLFEWVLAGLMLLSMALGTLGVVRANRWAQRRLSSRKSPAQGPSKVGSGIRTEGCRCPEGARQGVDRPEGALQDIANTDPRRLEGALRDTAPRPEPIRETPLNCGNRLCRNPAQNKTETPTHSRGRPAVPVYRRPPTEGPKTILAVDNRGGCGQLGRWVSVGVRLVVVLLPAVLFAFYPQVVSVISAGRTVLWAQLFYFALPLTVTLAVAGGAGLAVFVARVVRLRSAR